jgi:hypothetical protein
MKPPRWAFHFGQQVRPRKEWRSDPNRIPSGPIRERQPWGEHGCYRIGPTDPRFWAADCLETADQPTTRH